MTVDTSVAVASALMLSSRIALPFPRKDRHTWIALSCFDADRDRTGPWGLYGGVTTARGKKDDGDGAAGVCGAPQPSASPSCRRAAEVAAPTVVNFNHSTRHRRTDFVGHNARYAVTGPVGDGSRATVAMSLPAKENWENCTPRQERHEQDGAFPIKPLRLSEDTPAPSHVQALAY